MGKIQIQDWFGNGIKRAALMNKWFLKEVAIDEDERCLLQTDGSFLYLLCKDGLYKVGSGYSGTVRVCSIRICMLLSSSNISPNLVTLVRIFQVNTPTVHSYEHHCYNSTQSLISSALICYRGLKNCAALLSCISVSDIWKKVVHVLTVAFDGSSWSLSYPLRHCV